MPDYYPLKEGRRLIYRHQSTEFEGQERVEVKIVRVRTSRSTTTAEAVMTRKRDGQNSETRVRIIKGRGEVRSEGSILGPGRREFPLPPAVGLKWMEKPDLFQVISTKETVRVPAGKFDRCLHIQGWLAGGDAGSTKRFYSPGLGLIYEEHMEESWSARIELVSTK